MDAKRKNITVTDKIIFVDAVPDCFATPQDSREHMESWINEPLDVNPEGDAYLNADHDEECHSDDVTIGYDCIAWPNPPRDGLKMA